MGKGVVQTFRGFFVLRMATYVDRINMVWISIKVYKATKPTLNCAEGKTTFIFEPKLRKRVFGRTKLGNVIRPHIQAI